MRPASEDQAAPAVTFDAGLRDLLDGRNFATLATLNPDGSPHASVLWVLREGNQVLASVVGGRQKTRNIARDPRVSITIFDLADPYHSAEIRGIAELVPDPAKELPVALSQKYLGTDPPAESDDELRLVVRVTPTKINGFSVAARPR